MPRNFVVFTDNSSMKQQTIIQQLTTTLKEVTPVFAVTRKRIRAMINLFLMVYSQKDITAKLQIHQLNIFMKIYPFVLS